MARPQPDDKEFRGLASISGLDSLPKQTILCPNIITTDEIFGRGASVRMVIKYEIRLETIDSVWSRKCPSGPHARFRELSFPAADGRLRAQAPRSNEQSQSCY